MCTCADGIHVNVRLHQVKLCLLVVIEAAPARWRAVNAPHLVALVRAGAKFDNGKLVERPETTAT
jgi:hypothetical protein